MRKFKFNLLTVLILFTCCNTYSQISNTNEVVPKTLSKVDKDLIQIKNLEGSYQDILKSIINVLHSKGYEAIKSNLDTGLITASLPQEDLSDSTTSRTISSVASALTFGIVGNDDKTSARTRDITIIMNSLNPSLQKIKIAMKETTTTETQNWVGSTKKIVSDLTDMPQIYEEIFNEIKIKSNTAKK